MIRLAILVAISLTTFNVMALDPQHAPWDRLLKDHVVLLPGGTASRVDYAGFKKDRAKLEAYTAELCELTRSDYLRLSRPQQMAFLTNAYNAFTISLVLTRYPDLKSIKDLGGFLSTPWKQKFFKLLGDSMSLDEIEGLLRVPGIFDDPRIHFAINCASIGCPMLREEAYVGDRIDHQLDDAMRRFLSDRTRNRYDASENRLKISKIFDWYGNDFAQGHHGFTSVSQTLSVSAEVLADSAADRERIRSGQAAIEFLSYDWRLNDVLR